MKKSVVIVSLLALTFSAFGLRSIADRSKLNSRQQFAITLVEALKRASSQKYVSLLPALSDFEKIMKENAAIYGNNLSEAQKEFALTYETKLVPSAIQSFETLLREGREQGIDWKNISLVNVAADEINAKNWGMAPSRLRYHQKVKNLK
jgi:hypothetical protein